MKTEHLFLFLCIVNLAILTGCDDDPAAETGSDDLNTDNAASDSDTNTSSSDADTTDGTETDTGRDPACGTLGLECPCDDSEVCDEYDICKPYAPSSIRCGLYGSTCAEERPVCLTYAEISGGTCMTDFEKQCVCSTALGRSVFSGCAE